MSAPPPKKPRPPLPEGPFLVVGLARSGPGRRAAAGRARGGGAGGRLGPPRGGGRACGGGRRSRPGYGWIGSTGWDADRRQEPGRAPGGAGDRGRAGAGHRRDRRARAGLAGDPEPLPRRDRDQRQDDRRRAARPRLPHAPGSRSPSPATSARRSPRSPARSSRPRPWSARPPASSSRTASPSPPSARSSSTSPPTTSTATRDLDSYLAAKLRIFANQGNDDVAVYNADEPALAGVDLGGCARRISFCVGAAPDCEVSLAEGTIFYDGEPLLRGLRAGPVRRAQRRQRDGRRGGGAGDGDRPRRRARGAAQLRRGPAPARAGRRDRRRPLRQRLEGDQRRLRHRRPARLRQGGVHAILGGSEKGEDFAPLARPGPRVLRRRLPDRRLRRAARRGAGAGRSRRGSSCTAATTSRTPCAAPRPPPAPARSSCSRRPAPASTPSRTSNGAAIASARSSGSSRERPLAALAGPKAKAKKPRKKRKTRRRPADRVQHAAHRDPLPAGPGRGDGLLGQLDHPGAAATAASPNSAFYLKRTLMFGAVGLLVMHLVARHGLESVRRLTPVLPRRLLLPPRRVLGAGTSVNGSSRWIGSGFLQIQPSELAKVALVLYAADLLARKPKRARSDRGPDAVPARRRRGLAADRDRARPGHGAGRRLRRRRDPGRGRAPGSATSP